MAKKEELIEVEAIGQGWHGGPYGSKEPGDRFDYDFKGDPIGLVKLGLVKKAGAAATSTGSGQAQAGDEGGA